MTPKTQRQQRERRGRRAETLAALWLTLRGYRVLDRRYRCPAGEIDILAEKDGSLIAVEVKARRRMDAALDSIRPKQKDRIEKALLSYARRHKKMEQSLRFDVITIAPWHLPHHIRGAWRASNR